MISKSFLIYNIPSQILLVAFIFNTSASFANEKMPLAPVIEYKQLSNFQELKWLKKIEFDYSTLALNKQERKVEVELYIQIDGSISNVDIIRSTGISQLDQQIIETIKTTAKFHPIPSPTKVKLPLILKPIDPKNHSASSWLVQPYLQYTNRDLNDKNRLIELNIQRDSKGYIEQITIIKSTGLKHLDEIIIAGFRNARLDPKQSLPKSNLVMYLNQHDAEKESTQVILDANISAKDAEKIWQYFPNLSYSNAELEGQNRFLKIRLVFSENGRVSHNAITVSSGIPALDVSILAQMKQAILYKSHAPVTLDIPLELKAKK